MGDVEIAGHTYSTSKALEDCDPIAYRCGFNDWADSELHGNIEYDLERMSDGDELEFYGITVEYTDEEEDEEEEEEEEDEEEEDEEGEEDNV